MLHCLKNLRDIELYRDIELRKEEVESEERKEFFSLLEQQENLILWKTHASKQSRGRWEW